MTCSDDALPMDSTSVSVSQEGGTSRKMWRGGVEREEGLLL